MTSTQNLTAGDGNYNNLIASFLPDFYWFREWHAYKDGKLTIHGAVYIKNYCGSALIALVNGLGASYKLVSSNSYLDDKFWFANAQDRFTVIIEAPIAEGVSFVNVTFCPSSTLPQELYRHSFSIYLVNEPNRVSPPIANIERVSGRGATNYNYFNNGATDFYRFVSLAQNIGVQVVKENCTVLDWGSGCARLTRHLLNMPNAKSRVLGVDIDPDNTLWANTNITEGAFKVVGLYPPIDCPDNYFDLIISNSVLSHLTESTMLQWLTEVNRLLKPDGVGLLSYHGNFSLAGFCSRSQEFVRKVLFEGSNSDQRAPELDNVISDPEYYRQTFLTDTNAVALFKRHLEYIDFIPGLVSRFQNVAICRKKSNHKISDREQYQRSIESQIQTSSYTSYNRHPTIFAIIRQIAELNNILNPAILSFGCSTGEEIFSLDDLYISNGRLVGVDISDDAISSANIELVARRFSRRNNKIKFTSSMDLQTDKSQYDFVLALSVLCKWPELRFLERSDQIYPFSDFCRQVDDLVRFVRVGGYLVIHNSNYYFEDSSAFAKHFQRYRLEYTNLGEVKRFDSQENSQSEQRVGHVFFERVA